MTRPSRTGGKTSEAKARNASSAKGRKSTKTKGRIAPAAARAKRRPVSSPNKDLKEAREQQAATAEILKVIASSPDDVQPVLEAVAERAMRLLDAWSVLVTRFDGELLRFGAARGALPDTEQFLRNHYPMRPEAAVFAGRCILERSAINISDAQVDPSPQNRDRARLRGFRAALSVPMLRDGQPIGVITVSRSEAGAFAANEVELLQTFADQAVIAIENVRLFKETQEALERQTATANILKVIASSPSDVQPVFDAIASSANRLIGGFSTAVHRVIDDINHLVAFTPTNPESDEALKAAFPRHRSEVPPVALVQNGETAQIADAETADAQTRQLGRARGWRSVTFTPLMSQGTLIGYIACTRRETGVLADHDVQLLRTFADQAVIAIENTRLFKDLRGRTDDLSESLQQQTATADVLKVISRSAFDLQNILDTLIESAALLCSAERAVLIHQKGETYVRAALHGFPSEAVAEMKNVAVDLNSAAISSRALRQ
jgi:GAF domain-containing protein